MADEKPDLASNGNQLPWYRGLSRYQWWVLIIASMGWMFDTMDQQFFNLGRGKAMPEVRGTDPITPGLEKLDDAFKLRYDAEDIDALIEKGLLTPEDKGSLLTEQDGKSKESATRMDVAKAIGQPLMTPTFVEMGLPLVPERLGGILVAKAYGQEVLDEANLVEESFNRAQLERLVQQGKLTATSVAEILDKQGLDKDPSKTISREALLLYVGKELLARQQRFDKAALAHLQELGVGGDGAVSALLADMPSDTLPKENVLRAIGKDLAEGRPSFDTGILPDLVMTDAIAKEASERLIEKHPTGVPHDALARHFGSELAKAQADKAGDNATFIFVMGWAIGGLFFGWVGDALGRAKTMALTILTYAIFTGLNGLAETELQFNILRFLTALGVGGEFAAGAALVAESMPERSRPAALGTLQALSAVGNMMGAALAFFIMPILGWRWLFAVGAVPGLVAVFVFLKLKEPEKWKEARRKWLEERAQGIKQRRSSYLGLLGDPRWRKRAIIGLLLGVVGVGGLWGVGFFTPELNRLIAKNYSEEKKEEFVSIAFFLQQFGAFLGISAYTVISLKMGRRPAFGLFFILAFVIVSYTFLFADTITEAYVLAPLVGFVTLGPFGGYAIYFPELFPTRLRSTGVGFCYNVGRFLAALIPSFKSGLKGLFMSGAMVLPFLPAVAGSAERAIRYGSFMMIFIYIVGLIVLIFAPETKGQPLPEE